MTEGGQTVCLCMIVRDEAHVIERCLESVRPFIDKVAICDTGSTDGTFAEIYHSRALRVASIEPTVRRDAWVDFATNRNQALQLTEETGADYALIMDADDWITAPPDYPRLPGLNRDAYDLDFDHAGITYTRPQLVRLGRGCRWRGVLHEFLELPPGATRGSLPITVHYGGDGARSRDPGKFRKDAEVLEVALKSGADQDLHPRYAFYLAQSYRDAGEPGEAFQAYLHRARMGGWSEEMYVSLLMAGRLAEQLKLMDWQVVDCWYRAQGVNPNRVEALIAHARYLRERERYREAYELLNDWRNRYLRPVPPHGALFAETSAYRYGFWDELSVSAYWSEHHSISLDAALQALKGDPPPADRERIVKNAEFALQKL